jgi:hypothetical protein
MRLEKLRLAMVSASIVAASLSTASCGGTTTSPTTASPVTTTDTFTGTFVQGGSAINPFAVSTTGGVTITLTTVAPLSSMSLGVAVAIWDGTTCGSPISVNTDARAGAIALTGNAAAGNYCVRVYDSGNVPADTSVNYTVQVVHP